MVAGCVSCMHGEEFIHYGPIVNEYNFSESQDCRTGQG